MSNNINMNIDSDSDDGLIHINDEHEELIDSIFSRDTELEVEAAVRNRLRSRRGRNIDLPFL